MSPHRLLLAFAGYAQRAGLLLGLLLTLSANCRAGQNELLGELKAKVKADAADFVSWNKLADAELSQLSATGDLACLTRAAEAVEHSLQSANPEFNHGGLAVRARVALASHRFTEARRDAELLRTLMPDSTYPLHLLGDALLNLGEYEAATRAWHQLFARDGSTLATEPRLAQLDLVYGRTAPAHEHLTAALALAEKLTPPSPETVAWCHVQLGELAFRSGDWETAGKHYTAARAAQPDYYAALDHLAELRGAQGRIDEAIATYTHALELQPRPELMQALGDLYLSTGRAADAQPWHDHALAAYLVSVEHGEALYFHHLTGFYADSVKEPAKAVEWARRDLVLRPSIQACDALAWALHKAGQNEEASSIVPKALATGTHDAHILYHAGLIRMAAGNVADGSALLQQALAANPRYNTFHVHR